MRALGLAGLGGECLAFVGGQDVGGLRAFHVASFPETGTAAATQRKVIRWTSDSGH